LKKPLDLGSGIPFVLKPFETTNRAAPEETEGDLAMAWKGLACAAALAVLGCSSVVLADQTALGPDNVFMAGTASSPIMLDDTTAPSVVAPAATESSPTSLTPLMFALDSTSFGKWMEDHKFNITGYGELGYFIDTNNPRLGSGPTGDSPTLIGFPGPYSNRFLLDQLDLSISKGLDSSKSFDWGFLVETGYGTDDAFIHSHGILDNAPPGAPQNQWDLLQANVSLLLPVGSGLTVTAGKFVAYLGQEVISPVGNLFYTHSYSFSYAIMYTNTGIMGSYTFSKLIDGNDLTVSAGITNGWNQSLRDNNSAIDFLGQAKFSISKLSMVLNFEEGPEAAGDNADYWTAIEAIPSYSISDQLTLTGDIVYVDAPHFSATNPGASAQWYGVVVYPSYKICSMLSFNTRLEWYRDQGGATTGVQANYYALTLGLQIHPMPDNNILQFLQVRPEIRVDDADQRVFNHGSDYSELTFAVDAFMQF
jgi:Putative beta-barrel porin-2, OmpL-like. bbp2